MYSVHNDDDYYNEYYDACWSHNMYFLSDLLPVLLFNALIVDQIIVGLYFVLEDLL